jgi:hypothetical protein
MWDIPGSTWRAVDADTDYFRMSGLIAGDVVILVSVKPTLTHLQIDIIQKCIACDIPFALCVNHVDELLRNTTKDYNLHDKIIPPPSELMNEIRKLLWDEVVAKFPDMAPYEHSCFFLTSATDLEEGIKNWRKEVASLGVDCNAFLKVKDDQCRLTEKVKSLCATVESSQAAGPDPLQMMQYEDELRNMEAKLARLTSICSDKYVKIEETAKELVKGNAFKSSPLDEARLMAYLFEQFATRYDRLEEVDVIDLMALDYVIKNTSLDQLSIPSLQLESTNTALPLSTESLPISVDV